MYPSGRWEGFWEYRDGVRGPMSTLTLRFGGGAVGGEGVDMVAPFTFDGEYDEATGEVRMVKRYVGRHRVLYVGRPDGEGCIQGTWTIGPLCSGSFRLRPVLPRPAPDEPIAEIV